jgi:hypothetical protein
VGWMRTVLLAAAAYNVLWGGFVVLFPLTIFRFLGIEPPNYPQIWQCISMIVGVYGVGYAAAALDPVRHWPVVLAGLLGKILGPIGFLSALVGGTLPLSFSLTILTNDLIQRVPFALILLRASKPTERRERRTREPPRGTGRQCTSLLLETPRTSRKETLETWNPAS